VKRVQRERGEEEDGFLALQESVWVASVRRVLPASESKAHEGPLRAIIVGAGPVPFGVRPTPTMTGLRGLGGS
jgi:hypothetical protein